MPSRQILVIDDERDILMLARCGLELEGWEVITSSSPVEGVEMAVLHQPDAILLDLTFPQVDGREVVRELQAHEATRSIPVLLVSGRVQPGVREELLSLGVAGLVEKPFDATTLGQQVSEQLHWEP